MLVDVSHAGRLFALDSVDVGALVAAALLVVAEWQPDDEGGGEIDAVYIQAARYDAIDHAIAMLDNVLSSVETRPN